MTAAPLPCTPGELDDRAMLSYALEHMLHGMLLNRALLPQVVVHTGSLDDLNDVAIDLWMGASPVYTHRLRALMGIDGDDVPAIMKALQLDCGFVHQYMDVAYKVNDPLHGEFWLNHCGALLDAEDHGEERVFGMCHTIEDPTFDATAYATNPRARIRPIHRPPRSPADRHPHCHWTIEIDPANDPVGAAVLTEQVRALPLAAVPNALGPDDRSSGRRDYAGELDPQAKLAAWSRPTLEALTREFDAQAHLLAASGELALEARYGRDNARMMLADSWVATGWNGTERLVHALGLTGDPADVLASVLALHPGIPFGFDRAIDGDGDTITLRLTPAVEGLLDPDHPGTVGLVARAERGGIEAIARPVAPRARVRSFDVSDDSASIVIDLDAAEPADEPASVAFMRFGLAPAFSFDLAAEGA
ncbi:MAG: hypothetical protein R6X23_11395 [Acidimicrobiia bacterium]